MKEASYLNFSDEDDSTILKLMQLEKNLELIPEEYKRLEYLERVKTACKAGAHFCKLQIKELKKLHEYRKEFISSPSPLHAQSSPTMDVQRSPTTVNINASGVQVTVAGNIEAERYNQKD